MLRSRSRETESEILEGQSRESNSEIFRKVEVGYFTSDSATLVTLKKLKPFIYITSALHIRILIV